MLLNLDENSNIKSSNVKVESSLTSKDVNIPLKNKPRKKSVSNKEDNIENDLKNILMYATLINHPVWKIEQDEIDLIIKPLSNILKRMGLNKKNSEYVDYISLITGLSIIVLPRLIIQLQIRKEKNKNEGKIIANSENVNEGITSDTKKPDSYLYPNI